jgi:hypothetical protein
MCIQIDLLNTHNNLPFSICKNIAQQAKKTILIARLTKMQGCGGLYGNGKKLNFVYFGYGLEY